LTLTQIKKASIMSPLEEFIVVTGATRGVGEKLTATLIATGQSVIAVGRNTAQLHVMKAQYGDRLVTFHLDLSDPKACDALAMEISENFALRGLINNGAVQHVGLLRDQTWEQIDQEIRTNLTAPAILSARLASFLPERRGFIANITSGLAIAPKSDAAVYCATKAGLRSLTRGVENQLSSRAGITLIDIVLPLVDTGMTAGRGKGKISAEAAAKEILNAIQTKQAVRYVGRSKLLACIDRFSPALAATIMRKM
jgi:uncharacterized oxidoreductase